MLKHLNKNSVVILLLLSLLLLFAFSLTFFSFAVSMKSRCFTKIFTCQHLFRKQLVQGQYTVVLLMCKRKERYVSSKARQIYLYSRCHAQKQLKVFNKRWNQNPLNQKHVMSTIWYKSSIHERLRCKGGNLCFVEKWMLKNVGQRNIVNLFAYFTFDLQHLRWQSLKKNWITWTDITVFFLLSTTTQLNAT